MKGLVYSHDCIFFYCMKEEWRHEKVIHPHRPNQNWFVSPASWSSLSLFLYKYPFLPLSLSMSLSMSLSPCLFMSLSVSLSLPLSLYVSAFLLFSYSHSLCVYVAVCESTFISVLTPSFSIFPVSSHLLYLSLILYHSYILLFAGLLFRTYSSQG